MSRSLPVHRLRRLLAGSSAVVVAVGLVLVGTSVATAGPSTKYYTVTAPSVVPTGTTSITVTLGNCGATSSTCPKASQQPFGSALITIPSTLPSVTASFTSGPASKLSAWHSQSVSNGVLLTNTGSNSSAAIAPGESLGVTLTFASAPSSGAYTFTTDVKQSNDFSGTGNDFLTLAGNASPSIIGSFTVYVGYPDHLAFIAQPQSIERYVSGTVQDYNQMCAPPSVGVYDSSGNLISLNGLSVTLSPATGSNDPSLHRVGSTTVSASTSSGVATFGTNTSGSCSNGVYATTLGFGFTLKATATWQPDSSTSVNLATTSNSSPFDVLQYRRPCETSCSTNFTGVHVTSHLDASGTTRNVLTESFGTGNVAPLSCTSQLQDGTFREGTAIDLDNHSKTVTLTFDKFIFNNTSNNGTPFWDICFGAPFQFPTRTGYSAQPTGTPPTGEYEGLLVDCGSVNTNQFPVGTYPCVASRKRNAANEIIVISIPLNGSADPRMT